MVTFLQGDEDHDSGTESDEQIDDPELTPEIGKYFFFDNISTLSLCNVNRYSPFSKVVKILSLFLNLVNSIRVGLELKLRLFRNTELGTSLLKNSIDCYMDVKLQFLVRIF